jgi:hypothetical protein
MSRKIYLASSWRNKYQPPVVAMLRQHGHDVYDYRHPTSNYDGFKWSEVDQDWLTWTPKKFAELITTNPIALHGFSYDKAALDWCDTCVLLLPSGRSAHLEAGYAAGQGKKVAVLLYEDGFEPELMYLLCDPKGIVTDVHHLVQYLDGLTKPKTLDNLATGAHDATPV